MIMGHKAVVLCASAVSLAVGAVGGYFYAKHRLEEQYMELAENEIAEARDRYRRMGKYDEYETPESAAKALLGADASDEDTQELRVFNQTVQAVSQQTIEDYNRLSRAQGYVADSHDPEEPEDIPAQRTPVEAGEQPMRTTRQERAFREEVAKRNHSRPYIISQEEFFENDGGLIQVQYKYYEGDGVIADTREEPLENYELIIGANTLRFGHLSDDPNVVYIRNEQYECDIEIVRVEGSYGEEIQGFITDEPARKEWIRESNGSIPSRFEGRRYSTGVVGGDNV